MVVKILSTVAPVAEPVNTDSGILMASNGPFRSLFDIKTKELRE